MGFTKGPDAAKVHVQLNGSTIGGPIALKAGAVTRAEEQSFGVHNLSKGCQTFSLEMLDGGTSPAQVGIYAMNLKWIEPE